MTTYRESGTLISASEQYRRWRIAHREPDVNGKHSFGRVRTHGEHSAHYTMWWHIWLETVAVVGVTRWSGSETVRCRGCSTVYRTSLDELEELWTRLSESLELKLKDGTNPVLGRREDSAGRMSIVMYALVEDGSWREAVTRL